MAEEIKCALCEQVYVITDAGIQSHFEEKRSSVTEGLKQYVIALQKRIEKLEKEHKL